MNQFNQIKKIFYSCFVLLTLMFSVNAVANVNGTDANGNECRTPKVYSSQIHNQPTSNYLPPCGPYLTQNDKRFEFIAPYFVTKENVEKNKEWLENKGYVVDDNSLNKFSQNSTVTSLMTAAVLIIGITFVMYVLVMILVTLTENKVPFVKFLMFTFALGIISTFAMSPNTQIKVIGSVIAHINYSYEDNYNVKYELEKRNLENVDKFAVEESETLNSNVISFLYEASAQDLITKYEIFKNQMLVRNAEYDPQGSIIDVKEFTNREKLALLEQCTATTRTETKNDLELTLSIDKIKDLDFGASISHKASLWYGGEAVDWECDSGFGYEKVWGNLTSYTTNNLKNFHSSEPKKNMSQNTSYLTDLKAMVDKRIEVSLDVIEKIDIDGSNGALMNTSEMNYALNTAKEIAKNGGSYRDTKSFPQLVASLKRQMKSLSFEKDDAFTVEEANHLRILGKEQFKFSKLFGHFLGSDEQTDEDINGYYYMKPYFDEAIYSAMAYECSTRLSMEEFLIYQNFAKDFNAALDEDTKKLKQIGARNDLNCFRFNDNFEIEAVGNPNLKDKYWQDMFNYKQAFQYWLKAIDVAANEIVAETNENHDDKIKELLNIVAPNAKSLSDFKIALIDFNNKSYKSINTQENIFTYKINSHINYDSNKPNYYYVFDRFTKDVLSESEVEKLAKSNALKKYDLSPILTPIKRSDVAGDIELESFTEKLGTSQLIDDLMIGAECPIIDNDGSCDASIIQQAHHNTQEMTEAATTFTIIKFAGSAAAAACEVSDGANFDMKAVLGGPMGIALEAIGTASCISIQSYEIAFGDITLSMVIIAWFAVIMAKLTVVSPLIVDIFLLLFFIRAIPTLVIMLALVMPFELGRNSIKTVVSDKPVNELFHFNATVSILKALVFRIAIVVINIKLLMYIIHNETFGGVIFDMVSPIFPATLIGGALFGICYNLFSMFIPVLAFKTVGKFEEDLAELIGISSGGFMSEQSQIVGAVHAYATGKVYNDVKGDLTNATNKAERNMKERLHLEKLRKQEKKKKRSMQPQKPIGKRVEETESLDRE
ncbi:hypothetical protein PQE20_17770 [Vibrio harveyi]|uniref:hypothetical protein n=1 Tax=Vibrio harveyi TaxID=669 RepID=UPI00234CE40C|nr:hypothetical protein [Vibrio harveyi]WCP83267.1 hypothetical protein PQE20_17770 [Vibrio harveyi]